MLVLTRRKTAVLLAALAVATAAALAWFTVPYPTSHTHPDYAMALDTPEKAAGWADDVLPSAVDKASNPKDLYARTRVS